ncbi:exodeoxyribonuclease VII small subunit [Streptococcus merionis]|uniref:Exodeoxyribonuclease 7 small subunit n=1 Tax=Streptococcus merionis TaxID=400065 RepID=A0A239SLC2_9STRE|nr:exodeoxyribonuclease VII small subunit [Streptococcus merionis]SNU86069.1 Exodeoxyribonuclease VII small subunit [Streptococcus merionis]
MSKTKKTFEDNLAELETIVGRLESGDIALEEALSEFQKGMVLSKELQATLAKAEETLVKVMQEDGTEVEFNG